MPSLRKKVRGILRQISLTGSSTAAEAATNEIVDKNNDLMRTTPPPGAGANGSPGSLRNHWPVNDAIYDYHHIFSSSSVAQGTIKNGYCLPRSNHNRGHTFNQRRDFCSSNQTIAAYRPFLSARENGINMNASFIHMYLTGRLKKRSHPEIYYGKTGVDLPVLQIVPLNPAVFASQTGPDGGLTEVSCVNNRPLVKIANLDDELKLSLDGGIDTISTTSSCIPISTTSSCVPSSTNTICEKRTNVNVYSGAISSHSNGDAVEVNKNGCKCDGAFLATFPVATVADWNSPHARACGLSASLYERHPYTHVRAGDPVADVFAVCARQNSCILALADGVNWGERSRLAARCAIRGAIDYLNDALYSNQRPMSDTSDIFRCLLRAFHAGHKLILQEGGALTTLCVVVTCQLKGSAEWVVCSCNVGDSLAFVFSEMYGVREVTLGSHDIRQMRDMRDAGGALGPVDGVNPELHNFTCSMTVVDESDWIFLTSDGVSDNFDPVVGKFCVINNDNIRDRLNGLGLTNPSSYVGDNPTQDRQKRGNENNFPNSGLTCLKSPITSRRAEAAIVTPLGRQANSLRVQLRAYPNELYANLPVVEAYQRHELMLLRLEYVIRRSAARISTSLPRTAHDLCEALLNFVMQLTSAKRNILEDPESYRCDNAQVGQREQKQRRRLMRQRIAAMPGKLDHATLVAYRVGEQPLTTEEDDSVASVEDLIETSSGFESKTGSKVSILQKLERSTSVIVHEPSGGSLANLVVTAGSVPQQATPHIVDKDRSNTNVDSVQNDCTSPIVLPPNQDPAESRKISERPASTQDELVSTPAFRKDENEVTNEKEAVPVVEEAVSAESENRNNILRLASTDIIPQVDAAMDPRVQDIAGVEVSVQLPKSPVRISWSDVTRNQELDIIAGACDNNVLQQRTTFEKPEQAGFSYALQSSDLGETAPVVLRQDSASATSSDNQRPSVRVIIRMSLVKREGSTSSSNRNPEAPSLISVDRGRPQQIEHTQTAISRPSDDSSNKQTTPKTKLNDTVSRDQEQRSPGKFGKLSKALDRLERVVKRKHRRNSPSRHTVAVGRCQMGQKQWTAKGNQILEITGAHASKSACSGDTFLSVPSCSSSPRQPSRLRWSPIRALREWTSRNTSQADRFHKHPTRNKSARSDQSTGAREIASVSTDCDRTVIVPEFGVCIVPHSVSDTQIVYHSSS